MRSIRFVSNISKSKGIGSMLPLLAVAEVLTSTGVAQVDGDSKVGDGDVAEPAASAEVGFQNIKDDHLARLLNPVFPSDPRKAAIVRERVKRIQAELEESEKAAFLGKESRKSMQTILSMNHVPDEYVNMVEENDAFTLVVPVQDDQAPNGRHFERLTLSRSDFETIEQYFKNVPYELRKRAMTNWLVGLSHENRGLYAWLTRGIQNSHPLWNKDGTVNLEMLPNQDEWEVTHIAGCGDMPFPKKYQPFLPVVKENAFYLKKQVAEIDRRPIKGEFELEGQGRFALLMNIFAKWYERNVLLVRPSDKDKDYHFDLATDHPFLGDTLEISAPNPITEEEFDVPLNVARILSDAAGQHQQPKMPITKATGLQLVAHANQLRPLWHANSRDAANAALKTVSK